MAESLTIPIPEPDLNEVVVEKKVAQGRQAPVLRSVGGAGPRYNSAGVRPRNRCARRPGALLTPHSALLPPFPCRLFLLTH
jgi:hypothetical protein